MTDLFGQNTEIIRTLGFYQPFGSLMLHGKDETRKVAVGKKPPFPLGKYVFYTTKEPIADYMLWSWSGEDLVGLINETLQGEPTKDLHGWVIATGVLKSIRRMTKADEKKCFVKLVEDPEKITYCLVFENVQRITPFEFKDAQGKGLGKQGVGILDDIYKEKLYGILH